MNERRRGEIATAPTHHVEGGSQRQAITTAYGAACQSTEAGTHVGGTRPEDRRYVESTGAGEVGSSAAASASTAPGSSSGSGGGGSSGGGGGGGGGGGW